MYHIDPLEGYKTTRVQRARWVKFDSKGPLEAYKTTRVQRGLTPTDNKSLSLEAYKTTRKNNTTKPSTGEYRLYERQERISLRRYTGTELPETIASF